MNLESRASTSDSRCVGLYPTILPSCTRLWSAPAAATRDEFAILDDLVALLHPVALHPALNGVSEQHCSNRQDCWHYNLSILIFVVVGLFPDHSCSVFKDEDPGHPGHPVIAPALVVLGRGV